MEETLFKVGDKIVVVKYGHPAYINHILHDHMPDIVGKVGVIAETKKLNGEDKYAIDGIAAKYAWYDNAQLEIFKVTVN